MGGLRDLGNDWMYRGRSGDFRAEIVAELVKKREEGTCASNHIVVLIKIDY
jgi:hypothetical protein